MSKVLHVSLLIFWIAHFVLAALAEIQGIPGMRGTADPGATAAFVVAAVANIAVAALFVFALVGCISGRAEDTGDVAAYVQFGVSVAILLQVFERFAAGESAAAVDGLFLELALLLVTAVVFALARGQASDQRDVLIRPLLRTSSTKAAIDARQAAYAAQLGDIGPRGLPR
jgi:drug/metabolite transporter superfamily protein YnfA